MFRQHYLRELKKRYPNSNKFPIRQDWQGFRTMTPFKGAQQQTVGFCPTETSMELMNEYYRKTSAKLPPCPKCGNQLLVNQHGILGKIMGVMHVGSEYFCMCGWRGREMTGKDQRTAQQLRKKQQVGGLKL